MVLRWTAASLLEAERNFRKVAGYRGLPKLIAALRLHDDGATDCQRRIDQPEKAA